MLEYFFRQREVLREDHILFSFEQSMVFSKAEFGLIDQVTMAYTIWDFYQCSESEAMVGALAFAVQHRSRLSLCEAPLSLYTGLLSLCKSI